MSEFIRTMAPWPALAPYATTVTLPGTGLKLFAFDSQTPGRPVMLLIHGLGDEADTWRHVFGPLSQAHRAIAVDLPGFGRSDKPARDYTLPFYRDTLLALLEALSIPRAVLVGSSLGAAVAHALALQAPDRVSGLVLAAGTLIQTPGEPNPVLQALAQPGVGEGFYNAFRGNPQGAYDSLQPYYANLEALPAADREFLYQRVNERVWSDGQRDAYLSTVRQLYAASQDPASSLEAETARLSVPTHLVWGEKDAVASLQNAQAHAALQPTARLTIIPGVGHLPQQEAPAAFVEVVGGVGKWGSM